MTYFKKYITYQRLAVRDAPKSRTVKYIFTITVTTKYRNLANVDILR